MASMVHGTTSDSSSPAPATPAYRALPSLDRLLGAALGLVPKAGADTAIENRELPEIGRAHV